MDYLDPAKIKQYKQRLIVGYVLLAIIVGIGTFLLMMVASGYVVDTKSGDVVRNGAIIANSSPDNAEITLDNELLNQKTNNRITTNAGTHDIEFNLGGYTSFKRKFDLKPSDVKNLSYARLFLNDQKSDESIIAAEPSTAYSQSLDNETMIWCGQTTNAIYFKLKLKNQVDKVVPTSADLQNQTDLKCTESHPVNANIAVVVFGNQSTKINFLVDFDKKTLTNLSAVFGINKDHNLLIMDKKGELFGLQNTVTQDFSIRKTTEPTVVINTIKNVMSASSSSSGNIALIIKNAQGQAELSFYKKEKVHKLRIINSPDYQLKTFEKGNDTFVMASSKTEQKTVVFRAPDKQLIESPDSEPTPFKVLKSENLVDFGYSIGYKVLYVRTENHFLTYSFEEDKLSKIILTDHDTSAPLIWLDGYHFGFTSKTAGLQICDFDGSNVFSTGIKQDSYYIYKIDTYDKSEYFVSLGASVQTTKMNIHKLRDL